MSDLTFAEMSTDPLCPANSFVIMNGKVYLDVGVFIEETVTTLAIPKITELAIKLGRVGHAAQSSINSNRPSGTKLNSFQAPSFSPPVIVNGVITSRISVTAQGTMSVNPNDVNPIFQ